MQLSDLPEATRAFAERFTRDVRSTFGDNVAGIFTYGAACFPPSPVTDFDAHVLLHRPMTDADRDALRSMWERFSGEEHDVWFITVDDARTSDAPVHQGNTSMSDESWALHRAHVHAGRYVSLDGIDPREITAPPTWPEIDEALQHEADWLTEHFDDAPEFCVLNLCRIACSYANRTAVVSKLQGALWAIAALSDEHHELIRTSLDCYRKHEFGHVDVRGFYDVMRAEIERLRA